MKKANPEKCTVITVAAFSPELQARLKSGTHYKKCFTKRRLYIILHI